MNLVQRHQSLRRKKIVATKGRSRTILIAADILAYSAAFLSMFFTLDQIRLIWIEHNASGVSFPTWFLYTIASTAWLLYGIVHRERAIIMTNFLWIFINLCVAVGVLIYG